MTSLTRDSPACVGRQPTNPTKSIPEDNDGGLPNTPHVGVEWLACERLETNGTMTK